MVDQANAAEPLDALGERLDRDRISRLRDRHRADRLFAEVMEVERGVEHLRNHGRIRRDSLGDQIRRALRVPDFVGRNPRQQVRQDVILRLLAEAAEEVVGEVLGEHELDEPWNELSRRELRSPPASAGLPRAPRR